MDLISDRIVISKRDLENMAKYLGGAVKFPKNDQGNQPILVTRSRKADNPADGAFKINYQEA